MAVMIKGLVFSFPNSPKFNVFMICFFNSVAFVVLFSQTRYNKIRIIKPINPLPFFAILNWRNSTSPCVYSLCINPYAFWITLSGEVFSNKNLSFLR